MNFSELKGTSEVTFYNDGNELLLQACPSVSSGKTTKH